MAARTNYLIAIRDLIGHVDKVEIPVYLCDSILTPSAYGGLFAGDTLRGQGIEDCRGNVPRTRGSIAEPGGYFKVRGTA